MQGTPLFLPVAGPTWEIGYLKTTNLALSDANANLGTIKTGKAMTFAANSQVEMRYAGSYGFQGFITQDVNLNGLQDLTTYMQNVRGWLNQPIRRGLPATLMVPQPGSLFEVEGVGTVGVDTLIVTSGDNHIATSTTIGTQLTIESGAWRIAVLGEPVYGKLIDGNLTALISSASHVRAMIQIVSPYPMPVVIADDDGP